MQITRHFVTKYVHETVFITEIVMVSFNYAFRDPSNFRMPYVVRPVHIVKFSTFNFRFCASALQTESFIATCSRLNLRNCVHLENSCTNDCGEIVAILKSKYCTFAINSFGNNDLSKIGSRICHKRENGRVHIEC